MNMIFKYWRKVHDMVKKFNCLWVEYFVHEDVLPAAAIVGISCDSNTLSSK